jgi:hypothetical protein
MRLCADEKSRSAHICLITLLNDWTFCQISYLVSHVNAVILQVDKSSRSSFGRPVLNVLLATTEAVGATAATSSFGVDVSRTSSTVRFIALPLYGDLAVVARFDSWVCLPM